MKIRSRFVHRTSGKNCTKKQLKAVAAISRVVEVPTGTMLTRVGEPGEEFFFILDGAATVEVTRRKRGRMGPGQFFGEISVLDGGLRTADVQAESDTVCLTLVSWEVKPLLMENASITYKMLLEMVKRLRAQAPDERH